MPWRVKKQPKQSHPLVIWEKLADHKLFSWLIDLYIHLLLTNSCGCSHEGFCCDERIETTIMTRGKAVSWVHVYTIVSSTNKVTNTFSICVTISFIFFTKIVNTWTAVPCISLSAITRKWIKATVMFWSKVVRCKDIDTVVSSAEKMVKTVVIIITISFIYSTEIIVTWATIICICLIAVTDSWSRN